MGRQNSEIELLELALRIKEAEYERAFKNGALFEELRTIFMEKKALAEKVQQSKEHPIPPMHQTSLSPAGTNIRPG